MRIRWEIIGVVIAITTLLMTGCSHFETLVRSAENTFHRKAPATDTTTLDEAKAAFQEGNVDLAEERYQDWLERNLHSGDKVTLAFVHSQLGRLAHDKNDDQSGSRHFEKAIQLDPKNLELRGMYADSLYLQKDFKRAENYYRQALLEAPDDRRFQIMLGRTLAEQKQYVAGQRNLKQALGDQKAYEEMAFIYNKHGEFEMALFAEYKARDILIRNRQLALMSGEREQVAENGIDHSLMSVSQGSGNSIPAVAVQEIASQPPYYTGQWAVNFSE